MKIITSIREQVLIGDYTNVLSLLDFIRSNGDIAESIDEAWYEEEGIEEKGDEDMPLSINLKDVKNIEITKFIEELNGNATINLNLDYVSDKDDSLFIQNKRVASIQFKEHLIDVFLVGDTNDLVLTYRRHDGEEFQYFSDGKLDFVPRNTDEFVNELVSLLIFYKEY